MLSSNFYNCGLLVALSEILISRRQLIYNPAKAEPVNTLGKMEALHLVLPPPSKGTHKPKITQQTARDRGPQERKATKKSPHREWSWGSSRPARPLPQSGGVGRANPGCLAARTLAVLRLGGRSAFPPSPTRAPGISRTLEGFKGGGVVGPWRMPGVGRDSLPWDGDTKREREFAGVPGENKSAKEQSANWGRSCG